ncbi:hypothetical protein KP509_06G070600 [Ceratopteris richardii]|uniref:S1 motif domain-containing protein n=1 Tax=Ceratopteris richardii TaxID=49495 RepID=A0A8T2UM01_CERRI|nr:hypothetical protein KP509_06G070600 [Ceratopteris richardii]
MAASYLLRPLCTSHFYLPTPLSEDNVSCCTVLDVVKSRPFRPAYVLSCRGNRNVRRGLALLYVKPSSPTARNYGIVITRSELAGQYNAVAESNIDTQLNNPVFEAESEDANSTNVHGTSIPDPSTELGPEFDYQVYAANTMVGYEPPPPPRIPFGGPFEDYYDEYVGVDYVPKQEKPTSSFLMFLESLNEKRAEEEAKLREKDPSRPPFNPTPNKHLFEGKPLFTIPRPIQPAPVPRDYVPPDPDVHSTPRRIFTPLPPKEERRKAKKPDADKAPTEDGLVNEASESTTLSSDAGDSSAKSDAAVLNEELKDSSEKIDATAEEEKPVEEFSPIEIEINTVRPSPINNAVESAGTVGITTSDASSSDSLKSTLTTSGVVHDTNLSGRTLYPNLRSRGNNVDFTPSPRPFETTSNQPFDPTPRPFEPPADSICSLFPEARQGPMASGQERPFDAINGSGSNFLPQSMPDETSPPLIQGQPLTGANNSDAQSIPMYESSYTSQMAAQVDGVFEDISRTMLPTSEYYEPNDGDIVLGVVTYADADELSLDIGARVPALMTMRDFQPFTEISPGSFFKIPSDDGESGSLESSVAHTQGRILLVDDKAVNDGIYRGENVSTGTILLAEVHSRALVEGRPVLTCRRLARSLGFIRIEQIMRTGEPVEIEISQWNDGGLQGYLEGVRAFLPRSELLRRPENSAALQDYVGKKLRVAILKAEEYSSNVIVSELKPWMSENLLLGSVHDLLVTKLYPYGLQVEVIGTRIRGFIHISSISRGFVTSVHAFFVEGEETKGMVVKGRKPGQLSFSVQALEPPDQEGLFLRDKEAVYHVAEDIAKNSSEYQLPIEERRLFAMPSAATSVMLQSNIANLPWLKLENLRNL